MCHVYMGYMYVCIWDVCTVYVCHMCPMYMGYIYMCIWDICTESYVTKYVTFALYMYVICVMCIWDI